MPDQEMVLKALRCLSNPFDEERDCDNCSYDFCSCVLDVTADALELLKEQEPVPVIISDNEFGTGVRCDCGNCGETLIVLKDTNTEAASKMIRYCRKCGRAVKWDE
ncbi:MAG: hypothetical protein IKL85_07620 [Lentisphaeria bacterium]|nr:hypothetical protein [Lentisphaeria bacterium]